jgi:hypothetical protein
MLRPGGYTFHNHDGRIEEGESFTCRHCNRVSFVKPRERPEDVGGFCRCCSGLLCKECAGRMSLGGKCAPLEENLRRMEARLHLIQSFADDSP